MEFAERMENILNDKTCLVGVGNYYKTDDAAGLYLVDELKDSVSGNVSILNVEDIIEGYVFKIAENDSKNVILIDAVETTDGSMPGSVIFGRLADMDVLDSFSTHKLSLKLSGKILEEHGKITYLLGIAAEDIDFGTGLTPVVRESVDNLKDIIIKSLKRNQKEYIYEQ